MESSNRGFGDFAVGDVFRHPLGRTITAADNAWFTLLTMNTHEMHFNDDVAGRSEFGQQLVNSGLTVAIVLGLSVSDISQQAVANLGWDKIRLVAPVFVGETVYAESLVLATRPSGSRPGSGVVTVRTHGLKADGTVFMRFERSVLLHGASTGPTHRDRIQSSIPLSAALD